MDVSLKISKNGRQVYRELFPSLTSAIQSFDFIFKFFDSFIPESGITYKLELICDGIVIFDNSVSI